MRLILNSFCADCGDLHNSHLTYTPTIVKPPAICDFIYNDVELKLIFYLFYAIHANVHLVTMGLRTQSIRSIHERFQ
jgi:hypothetical protein